MSCFDWYFGMFRLPALFRPTVQDDASLLIFAAIVFASVCWVTLVVVFLPRLLGYLFAFLANRASRGSFHVSIPIIHIYPLAGRVVAHSVRYTNTDLTVIVEEFVLQCRWWRKHENFEVNQVLTVDTPDAFDPVILAQQKIAQENSARFLKRCWYRFRRGWYRFAVSKDPSTPSEPASLVSLFLVGLRVRVVNNARNYAHVQKVLAVAKSLSERTATEHGQLNPSVLELPVQPEDASLFTGANTSSTVSEASSRSVSSVQSIDEKPYFQRILELSSLRVSDGAFYFCDMGESPLVRLTVDNAKFRYRYGAPACGIDVCRKRIHVAMSSLKLSVASFNSVNAVLKSDLGSSHDTGSDETPNTPPLHEKCMEDNTDRMVQRVISMGYRGINDPFFGVDSNINENEDSLRPRRMHRRQLKKKLPSHCAAKKLGERKTFGTDTLSCIDVLQSNAAVIEYIFDEPGLSLEPDLDEGPSSSAGNNFPLQPSSPLQGEMVMFPSPACRVSVLLHGADAVYDPSAIADIERVQERLQPKLYDLLSITKSMQARDKRRMAAGLQIEVEVTPKLKNGDCNVVGDNPPLVRIPFSPQQETWVGLTVSKVRKWESTESQDTEEPSLPTGFLNIFASRLSVRTEIPFRSGVEQKTLFTMMNSQVCSEGVVSIPLLKSKKTSLTRTVQYPENWNGEHVVTTDAHLEEPHIVYVPDFMRIVGDVSASISKHGRIPTGPNYFVPFKETIRVRTQGDYNIAMSCGRENAWEDIMAGAGDSYGKLNIFGQNAELLIMPGVATEYHADSSVMSWSLSLPDASLSLQMKLSALTPEEDGEITMYAHSQIFESSRTGNNRTRPPSISKRARSLAETSDRSVPKSPPGKANQSQFVDIEVIQFDGMCKLKGKILSNLDRRYMQTQIPAFLDAVNTSDLSFTAKNLRMDLNPHHLSHILNVVRNYTGSVTHSLTVLERSILDNQRSQIARNVLKDDRYPTWRECVILGLPAGLTLSSSARPGVDDVTRMSICIDNLLLRLHDMPHPCCPFDFSSQNVCTIVLGGLEGKLSSNRLGSDFHICPSFGRSVLVYGGCFPAIKESSSFQDHNVGRAIPSASVEGLKIRKYSLASKDWCSYFSSLNISIRKVSGCLLDITVVALSRMGVAFMPDPTLEAVPSIAALLSVDNIDMSVESFDLFLISSSSSISARKVSQLNRTLSSKKGGSARERSEKLIIPKYFAGVSHVRMPHGFRILLSSLAIESMGQGSRILFPSISIDVLLPSGGKPSPWVDEATVRAQVAHAVLPRSGSSLEFRNKPGIMRRALEVQQMAVEITFVSRLSLWTTSVPLFQKSHILKQHEITRNGSLPWFKGQVLSARNTLHRYENTDSEMRTKWWEFLSHSNIAKIVSMHQNGKVRKGRVDILSIVFPLAIDIFVAPEFLELIVEIFVRAKEVIVRRNEMIGFPATNNSAQFDPQILNTDLVAMWAEFEKRRRSLWLTEPLEVNPGSSFKALETQGITIFLQPWKMHGSSVERSDSSIPSSDDDVFFSVPDGVQLLQELRFDLSPSDKVMLDDTETPSPSVVRTNILHGSCPVLNMGCNSLSLVKVTDMIFINHEREFVTNTSEAVSDDVYVQRDRKTIIGRIGTLYIGQTPVSLNTYETFGRTGSVFLLMLRTVWVECRSLAEKIQQRNSWVCEMLMSSSTEELLSKDPEIIRNHFVLALKSVQTAFQEVTTEGITLSNVSLPKASEVRSRASIPTQSTVHSIDLTLRDFSLVVENQEIAKSDFFFCKGGKTSSHAVSSDLDGYVLNASFGTISFSIRDDIAARSLRIVGNIASHLQSASFSLPSLKAGNWCEVSNSGADSQISVNTAEPFFAGSRGSSRHSRNVIRLRTSTLKLARKSSKYTRHHQLSTGVQRISGQRVSFSPANTERPSSNNRGKDFFSDYRTLETNLTAPSHSSDSIVKLSLQSNNVDTNSVSSEASINDRVGLVRPRSPINFFDLPEESSSADIDISKNGFKSVAVRTAGDSGPAQKRLRCLVPMKPVIPPAFSDIDENATSGMASKPGQRLRTSVVFTPSPDREKKSSTVTKDAEITDPPLNSLSSATGENKNEAAVSLTVKKKFKITLFVTFREIISRYYRGRDFVFPPHKDRNNFGDITFHVHAPRLTLMTHPDAHQYSVVLTASSSRLSSSNNHHCAIIGSIARIGGTISLSKVRKLSAIPKLLMSCRVSEFKVTLHATDLKSVLRFRNDLKMDFKEVLADFFRAKRSILEMSKTLKLGAARDANRTTFATMAFDVIFERSEVKLEGFHPNDVNMSVSYVLDGIFFSIVASEDDSAALALGLRLYGHGLLLSSPSWPGNEYFQLPSIDARGVQWNETVGLPTILKVVTDTLVSSTSFQGLRHVLFTVSGLLAFQNRGIETNDGFESCKSLSRLPSLTGDGIGKSTISYQENVAAPGATPFTRSFAAWERTKGVRMDVSIRPISLSLASGQVVALFDLETVTGVFEWNKLVTSGIQLQMAVSVPKVSLSFMRMPTADFTILDVRPDDRRTSLSIALEKPRIDLLKSQRDLTHTFVFRTNVFRVSGQLRPWRLLLDAAVWADEQEFVSDLQSINYNSLSASRERPVRSVSAPEMSGPEEHRLILFGANIQRVSLAVPLVNNEQYSSSRLAVRATDLYFHARHRFGSLWKLQNTFEVKSHFIGILWENSSLLSSHHAQIIVGVTKSLRANRTHFGDLAIVLIPGTWRVCPRKDVIVAVLDAKNRKDNKVSGCMPFFSTTQTGSAAGSIDAGDSLSNFAEKDSRLLVDKLSLKILRTSGFIEGLETEPDVTINEFSPTQEKRVTVEKLSVPAFSISVVRRPDEDFDMIDVDFSGREGEFPKGCLQKVVNLFSELFGAVASDRQEGLGKERLPQAQQNSRELPRNISILIRFGRSLYRAQEGANLKLESNIGLFAGKYSALLVSIKAGSVADRKCAQTTVVSGVSPKLALEITPLLEGAQPQSLRLLDARLLHGLCPCHALHSLLHFSRVTAMMEAKTLLLSQSCIRKREVLIQNKVVDSSNVSTRPTRNSLPNRYLMIILGKSLMKQKPKKNILEGPNRTESDIRVQLKFSTKANELEGNQANLAIEHLHVGYMCNETEHGQSNSQKRIYSAVHDVFLKGQWDILSCKLRMLENLCCFNSAALGQSTRSASLANIINRLYVENAQYGKPTLKLDIDALATLWAVPSRDVVIESTKVRTEVSHTLRKAITKFSSQWKKLSNEVKLLTERDSMRNEKSKASRQVLTREESEDVYLPEAVMSSSRITDNPDITDLNSSSSSADLAAPLLHAEHLSQTNDQTKVTIKGDEFIIMMRGYQFDETRHSAMVSLLGYNIEHQCNYQNQAEGLRKLSTNFKVMIIAYHDDERRICSELFKIPDPKLSLLVRDHERGVYIELAGDLEVRLGHGFYNWQEFRELLELTVRGIAPAPPREGAASDTHSPTPPEDNSKDTVSQWHGREVLAMSVRLNPRIDVIGDLTADVLPMMSARLKRQVDGIPRKMYDYIAIPLESFSRTVCDPLLG